MREVVGWTRTPPVDHSALKDGGWVNIHCWTKRKSEIRRKYVLTGIVDVLAENVMQDLSLSCWYKPRNRWSRDQEPRIFTDGRETVVEVWRAREQW